MITGGASGIGLATARRMRAEGATIVVGDIDPAAGKSVADELGGLFVPVDVTDEAAVNALFDTAARKLRVGRHRLQQRRHLTARRRSDRDHRAAGVAEGAGRQSHVGVPVLPCRVAPHGAAGKGSIINTASFVAVMGSATSQISYTASKGGVLAMSRELGVQYARSGIRVNALCPGPVNTPLLQGAVRQGSGTRGAPAGARAGRPVRRARGDRRRGGVPGQRRRIVHHRRRPSSSTAASARPTSPRYELPADPDPRRVKRCCVPVRPGNAFEDTVGRLLQTIRLGVLRAG